jgi:hypothetical protein
MAADLVLPAKVRAHRRNHLRSPAPRFCSSRLRPPRRALTRPALSPQRFHPAPRPGLLASQPARAAWHAQRRAALLRASALPTGGRGAKGASVRRIGQRTEDFPANSILLVVDQLEGFLRPSSQDGFAPPHAQLDASPHLRFSAPVTPESGILPPNLKYGTPKPKHWETRRH